MGYGLWAMSYGPFRVASQLKSTGHGPRRSP